METASSRYRSIMNTIQIKIVILWRGMGILFTDKTLLARGGWWGNIVQILPFLAWASTSYTCSAWGAGSQLSYDNIFASSVE